MGRSSARGRSLQHLMDFVSEVSAKERFVRHVLALFLRARAGKMRRIPLLTNGCDFSPPMPSRAPPICIWCQPPNRRPKNTICRVVGQSPVIKPHSFRRVFLSCHKRGSAMRARASPAAFCFGAVTFAHIFLRGRQSRRSDREYQIHSAYRPHPRQLVVGRKCARYDPQCQ